MHSDIRIRPTRMTCSVLLEQKGKPMLVQEGKGTKIYGKWNQPAGHLDPGEDLETCAKREALEESGYQVILKELVAVIFYPEDNHVQHPSHIHFCFRARPFGKQRKKLSDDILQARWFTKNELKKLPKKFFRGKDTIFRLNLWLKGKKGINLKQVMSRKHKK